MTGFATIFLHTLRERIRNVNRALLASAIFLIPLIIRSVEAKGGLPGSTPVLYLALVFGSGLIGADAASGVLHLVLVRPVSRPAYLLARWLGAAVLASGTAVVQSLLVASVLAVRGHAAGWEPLGEAVLSQMSIGFGLTAVLTGLSAAIAGLGDLRAWVLVYLFGEVLAWGGRLRDWTWLWRAGHEITALMIPSLPAPGFAGIEPSWWYSGISWASTVTLALAAGIAIFNRKEHSYGSA